MACKPTESLTFESLMQDFENNELTHEDMDTIDLAFIPDPNVNDSEDEMGKQITKFKILLIFIRRKIRYKIQFIRSEILQ